MHATELDRVDIPPGAVGCIGKAVAQTAIPIADGRWQVIQHRNQLALQFLLPLQHDAECVDPALQFGNTLPQQEDLLFRSQRGIDCIQGHRRTRL